MIEDEDKRGKLERLISMGFDPILSVRALQDNTGDVEKSIDSLISGVMLSPRITESTNFTLIENEEENHATKNPIPDSRADYGGVKIIKDITYEPFTHEKHMLDLYIPDIQIESPLPVVFHVHGGGWQRGDRSKEFYGGPFIGRSFAQRGFICVVISYRVGIPFPDPLYDVMNALKWTLTYIKDYDGDVSKLFISGHSAGAHLASLLVSTPFYLNSFQIPLNIIKGVMCISGVYTIGSPFSENSNDIQTTIYRKVYINPIFGKNPADWLQASPSYHLSQELTHIVPPFCIFNASVDLNLNHDGEKFFSILDQKGILAEYHSIEARHDTITRNQIVADICSQFIKKILSQNST